MVQAGDCLQACIGEEDNLVRMPCWNEKDSDKGLGMLVNAIAVHLAGCGGTTDIRKHTKAISRDLFEVYTRMHGKPKLAFPSPSDF